MLECKENIAYYKGLKSRVLDSVALLREATPREWLCNSQDYMIVVRWQQGVLGIGVGESEHETYHDIKIVGTDTSRMKEDSELEFQEVKEYMDWTYDDYVVFGL